MKAISGSLFSLDVLQELTADSSGSSSICAVVERALDAVGPASSARHLADRLGRPLARTLDLDDRVVEDEGDFVRLGGTRDAVMVVGGWGADLRRLRERSRAKMSPEMRWWIGINGRTLVLVDASAAYTRRAAAVDLELLPEDADAAAALRAVLRRGPSGELAGASVALAESNERRVAVSRELESGVERALRRLVEGLSARRKVSAPLDVATADGLTVIYRLLFLLFAEARGLVPQWHPVYRRSYTLESLRAAAERGTHSGVWEALQAISRLAHRGCRAGTLRVTPFNGRLFAPASAPVAETARLSDAMAAEALLALTTRAGDRGRQRISYADLGLEQLGAVYENVLDFAPIRGDSGITFVSSGRRKATGTFYTPRSMTGYLVRRTLAPLVDDVSPEQVLAIRVLDPAMGSGAFLVSACRFIAEAYERALQRAGAAGADDLGPADRARFRRLVAQKCLYGVDRNPTAVQLARLSLWLCTLAADRPLTFLDHHLRTGNSLVGVSPLQVQQQPPVRGRSRSQPLPLFGEDDLAASVASTLRQRLLMAERADDEVETVHDKERIASSLERDGAPLAAWRALCDAWCAAWFVPERMTTQMWGALQQTLTGRSSGLQASVEGSWRELLAEAAHAERVFHWEIEFPEIFFEGAGGQAEAPGFDAVLGNPPWDVLRGEGARSLSGFARESGCYRWQGEGHVNLYQLFAERMLALTRRGGRFGLLMPSGLIADHGSADLRRILFEQCRIDALLGYTNTSGIFPIHRGIKFALITGTRGVSPAGLPARFGLTSPAVLDGVPDTGPPPDSIHMPLSLLRDFSGEGLAVPELLSEADRAILSGVLSRVPPLGARDGWGVRFGRELNATDDKALFAADGMPVLEGKLIEPFQAHPDRAVAFVDAAAAERALGGRPFAHPRVGYREVASSTNRTTLIAAVIPPMTVTTHTIFCAKSVLPLEAQWFLCGVFNSLVANYLVRLRGGTHVPAAVIHRLPVPCPPLADRRLREIGALARQLSRDAAVQLEAELHARVADLYGIDAGALARVLTTFPLVDAGMKAAIADAFSLVSSAI